MSPQFTSRSVTPADLPAISELHAKTFGPGRFVRTAYRVREGTPAISHYCRATYLGDRLIAAVRMTPISIGGAEGALLLGPLVVDPDFAGQGFGKRLIAEVIEAARADGQRLVLLVGDQPYYGRFGFRQVPAGQIAMPGPVDPRRLLAAELADGALADMRGLVAGVPG
ncbi:putative acetyltransferase [Hyphomicrobium sp. 1Nfss2.1]|uniref:GNAT family N-acetyltransferase n=1 Tax=Hyphomicrobium sp. 1Nfss2.1 TaxID=3413936 RepID=UPI003C7D15C6